MGLLYANLLNIHAHSMNFGSVAYFLEVRLWLIDPDLGPPLRTMLFHCQNGISLPHSPSVSPFTHRRGTPFTRSPPIPPIPIDGSDFGFGFRFPQKESLLTS